MHVKKEKEKKSLNALKEISFKLKIAGGQPAQSHEFKVGDTKSTVCDAGWLITNDSSKTYQSREFDCQTIHEYACALVTFSRMARRRRKLR